MADAKAIRNQALSAAKSDIAHQDGLLLVAKESSLDSESSLVEITLR